MQTGLVDFAGAYHLCDASVSEDVACVDEAVQHLSCLLDQVTLVGIVLQLLIWRQKRTVHCWCSCFFSKFTEMKNCVRVSTGQGIRKKYNESVLLFDIL